jgi:MFS family permease
MSGGFWLVLLSQGISLTGNGIQQIALPLWILQETGSALSTGAAFALQFVPIVVLAPWAGHIADRFDRRTLIIVCELLAAVSVAGLIAAVNAGALPLVYLLILVTHAFNAVTMPALQAIIITLVPRENRARSASVTEGMQAAANMLSPIGGTLLAATWGIQTTLVANLASFVVAAALVVPLPRIPGQSALRGAARSTLAAVRVAAANRVLVWTVLTEGVYFLLFGGDLALVLLIAEREIGAGLAGICATGAAVGWLVTSLVLAKRNTRTPLSLMRLGAVGAPIAALAFVLLATYGPVAMFGTALLLGAVNILVVSGASTVFQQNVDAAEAGRTFAVRRAVLNSMLGLSYLLLPGVAQHGPGNAATLVIFGGLTLVAVLVGVAVASRLPASPTSTLKTSTTHSPLDDAAETS